MWIEDKELTEKDKGSKVTYIPLHARNNISHLDAEPGIISSWNERYVFVDYGKGTANATPPHRLIWG